MKLGLNKGEQTPQLEEGTKQTNYYWFFKTVEMGGSKQRTKMAVILKHGLFKFQS